MKLTLNIRIEKQKNITKKNQMRNILLFFLFILSFSACAPKQAENRENLSVSIYPQKFIIDAISGKNIHVNVMVKAGASPATYEPTPRQMQELSHTKAYLKIGNLGFEQVWLSKFAAQNSQLKIINLSQGLESSDNNPHLWMSPKQMLILAQNSYKALINLYPNKQKSFDQNYNTLEKQIKKLDSLFTVKLSPYKGKAFMIFHPALFYLARDYGLTELAIEEHGKSPSPTRLTEITDKAKKNNIRLIFIQKEFDRENAQVLAKETRATIVVIDPLTENWLSEEKNILKVLVQDFQNEKP